MLVMTILRFIISPSCGWLQNDIMVIIVTMLQNDIMVIIVTMLQNITVIIVTMLQNGIMVIIVTIVTASVVRRPAGCRISW